MYEDALYMSNLFAFLAIPTSGERARIDPPATVPARELRSPIVFEDVSFRYPSRPEWALRNVSLRLEPGETLGLVGENGAGKSTLVKLLLRLYDPTEGRITYGGVDLRDLDPADLRSRMGAVFQDFVRYQFTAAENIGLGNPEHVDDRPRIAEAARRAGAASLVESLPRGLDTVLGGWFEAGHEISAGQWQKLAVARAFMRDAEVLILDEPTASIDAEAEHELFVRFRELAAGRTAIVISHRFSTVRIADRIAVLHGGRVEELGSHRELVDRARTLRPPLLAAGAGLPGLGIPRARRRADPLAVRLGHGRPGAARARAAGALAGRGARGRTLDLGCGTGRNLPLLPAGDPGRSASIPARRAWPARAAARPGRPAGPGPRRGASLPRRLVRHRRERPRPLLGDLPRAAAAEMLRVLAPGGTVRALEHVRSTAALEGPAPGLDPARLDRASPAGATRTARRSGPSRRPAWPSTPATRRARDTMRRFEARPARR